jgi:hypothetical protein
LTISSLKRSTTIAIALLPVGAGARELVRPELVECTADVVEHLGGDVVRQAVADYVPLPTPPHRGGLAEYP